jgi:hypothetical protein
MSELLSALKLQVQARGLVDTAHMLGHNNTQTLSRWIRLGKIPDGQVGGVRAILEVNKVLKAAKTLRGGR